MEFLTTVVAVFVGVLTADLAIAAIVTARSKEAYAKKLDAIRHLLSEAAQEDDARPGGGYM